MSKRNRELFTLPPYVLYVARAFSTLEGIGLTIDENYSIVQECYPYLAKRLFTDRSPRAKKALRAMLGLSEVVNDELPVDGKAQSSALAIVQAGANVKPKTGALSPRKLIEMSEGFSEYTATGNADVTAGQAAAAKEFLGLFLDPKGSTLQDILIDETARFGDAATRAALRAALVESTAARAATTALKTQKQLIEQSPFASLIPRPLKQALIDRPSELRDLVETLVATSEEDERILASASELREAIGSRLTSRSVAAEQLNDGAAMLPSQPNLSAVRDLLANEENRKTLSESLPGAAALGRRLGAGLLRRAAYRTDKSSMLPEGARQALIDANTRLANVIDLEDEEPVN